MSSTTTSFVDNLMTAARENPLAAALIGGGTFWLFVGDQRLKTAARSAREAVGSAADIGTSTLRSAAATVKQTVAPPTAPEMEDGRSMGVSVGETLQSATSNAVSGITENVQDGFDQGVAFAQETFGSLGNAFPDREALDNVKSLLTDILERQPLVLGVVGIAIGAAVAGAFRASEIENEYIGQVSDDLKADLNRRAGAVSQALREASDTVVAEISDSGADVVNRVTQVGQDAVAAARAQVKSAP